MSDEERLNDIMAELGIKPPGRVSRWLAGPASKGLDNAPPKLTRATMVIAGGGIAWAIAHAAIWRSGYSLAYGILWVALAVCLVSGDLLAHRSYRRGWWNGRSSMIRSLSEAVTRGEPIPTWMANELKADLLNDELHDGKAVKHGKRGRRAAVPPKTSGS